MQPDIVCLSHLRWDFVYQRPNHLMARAARDRRVFFVEEPLGREDGLTGLRLRIADGVIVVTPQVPRGLTGPALETMLRALIDDLVASQSIVRPVLWYYTPMALPWTQHLAASAVVYDCMDHLAGFKGAPAGIERLESRLLARADLLFTGGVQLHNLKSGSHHDAHCFPSSVDVGHFARARAGAAPPPDQAGIAAPRIGYAGVIDERLDLQLVRHVAASRPDWSVVLIGPTAKIDPASIPDAPNIHRLGRRSYEELPAYLAGWEVGIMPFAHNEATRLISPTKTPEYLAAGLRVASTSIRDVVDPYGRAGLVHVGDGPEGFLAACDAALATPASEHVARADALLASRSWDATWEAMDGHLARVLARRRTDLLRPRRAMPAAPARPSAPAAQRVPLAGARAAAD